MTAELSIRVASPSIGRKVCCFNSGANRVLALDREGRVVRDTGPIQGLNPGGGIFGSDGR